MTTGYHTPGRNLSRRMANNPLAAEGPEPETVLAALDDEACRAIVAALDEPMTAAELAEHCGLASSTTYRKLDRLTDADLLEERTELRPDGHHTTRYQRAFERVSFDLDDEGRVEVEIERPSRSGEDRLADLWTEVRRQT